MTDPPALVEIVPLVVIRDVAEIEGRVSISGILHGPALKGSDKDRSQHGTSWGRRLAVPRLRGLLVLVRELREDERLRFGVR